MRILGIDFGERRIGVAISDPDGRWALPLTTIIRDTDRRAVYRLVEIVRRESIEALAIGRPRRLDGSESSISDRIVRFGAKLEKATRLPIIWIEETLTSKTADELIASSEINPNRQDMIAAQIILQEALDQEPQRNQFCGEGP